jgi:hypothetical protein
MTQNPWENEICPRCEEAILTTKKVAQDIAIEGASIRVPGVQIEECLRCGFRSVSGREVGLFELLFASEYAVVGDLIAALKTAGYCGMFLKENRSDSSLAFGSPAYVADLSADLRPLYMDNESSHIIGHLNQDLSGQIPLELNGRQVNVKLPKLGEGENGVVYAYPEDPRNVLKIAKPRNYSRDHLRLEHEVTLVFDRRGIRVPRIVEADPYGRFMIKEKLAGESLARLYEQLGAPENPRHRLVFCAVERFVSELLDFFGQVPDAKTSISPNNIFVLLSDDSCSCVLVDTGPAPFHDYSDFSFQEYWNRVIPEKIQRYKAVGYI